MSRRPSLDALPPSDLLADMVREHLRKGHPISLRVGGLSMLPLIPPGVTLTIRPLAPGEVPAPGTIVALFLQGHLACHLLREWRETPGGRQFRTAGLLPDRPDPWLPASDLLGVVHELRVGSRVIPLAGRSFGVWKAVARGLAPTLRLLKRAMRPLLPPEIRRKVYRRLAAPSWH